MNILDYLKEVLIADACIQEIVNDRIYFIRTTESTETSKPFITIRSLNGEPSTFVSDKYLSETFFVQIDVQSFKYDTSLKVANRIRKILWTNGFKQEGNEFDEHFEKTNRYVLARKYLGIPKNKYYKGELVE